MMIKRCLTFLCMSFALCIGAFSVQAAERITYITAASFDKVGSFGDACARHELALIESRTGSQTGNTIVSSNLIALSNHFGLASAAPFGVPDWDRSATA